MKIGLAMGVVGIPLPEYRDIAQSAEAAGAYALCVGEAANESIASATYFGTVTCKPKIITAITTWVRPPVNTALGSTTIDSITDGRFELGLGTMPDHWNREHYQIDPARPTVRMREYVAAIRQSWLAHSGAKANFSGEFYQINGYQRLAKPLRDSIPIHLAATRPGMAKLAGEIADGVIVNWLHTYEWLHQSLEPALATGSQISGNSCQRSAMVRVLIEPDAKKARDVLRPSFDMYRSVPYFHEITASAGFSTTPTSDLPDELVDAMTVHGSIEQVTEIIGQRYGGWADWLELIPPGATSGDVLRTSYDGLFELLPKLKDI
jgi:alkanesulfonate monooxygenase SsuD/methylene tetrahydromethanopterin reductase-like flavin-dependent oxidoreductase (luciferase family)